MKKQLEENYKDGKRHGKWTEWYENGQKQFEENYKDGKRIDVRYFRKEIN